MNIKLKVKHKDFASLAQVRWSILNNVYQLYLQVTSFSFMPIKYM